MKKRTKNIIGASLISLGIFAITYFASASDFPSSIPFDNGAVCEQSTGDFYAVDSPVQFGTNGNYIQVSYRPNYQQMYSYSGGEWHAVAWTTPFVKHGNISESCHFFGNVTSMYAVDVQSNLAEFYPDINWPVSNGSDISVSTYSESSNGQLPPLDENSVAGLIVRIIQWIAVLCAIVGFIAGTRFGFRFIKKLFPNAY
jgi:hypothetical protein